MAFIQYMVFDGMPLPLPDSYEVSMEDGGRDHAEGCGAAWGCEYFRELFGKP